jgi:endonuclease/exonuclease/phosphatase family metal-dependent hydrolase
MFSIPTFVLLITLISIGPAPSTDPQVAGQKARVQLPEDRHQLPGKSNGRTPQNKKPDLGANAGNQVLITFDLLPATIYEGDRVTLRWEVKDRRPGVAWGSPVHISSSFNIVPAIPDPAPVSGSHSFTAGASHRRGTFTLTTGTALSRGEKTIEYRVELTPSISRLSVDSDRADFLLSTRAHRDDRVELVGSNFGQQQAANQVTLRINGQSLPMPVLFWSEQRILVRVHNITPIGSGTVEVSKGSGRLVSNRVSIDIVANTAPPVTPLLSFGRPRIVRPTSSNGRDLSDHYGLAVEVTYNPVAGRQNPPPTTFTVLTYNIAQVPTFYEGSRSKTENIDDIARHLNDARYGIVCLQEAFDDDTRDRLKRAVRNNYPYQKQGHDGDGPLEGDSGLLILSRFNILQRDLIKFSQGTLDVLKGKVDYLAAKGVLHTRIQIGTGVEDTLDIFTTHTDSTSASIRRSQFRESIDFIKRHSRSDWWILAGDLNTKGDRQNPDYARLGDQYSVMMNTLGRPRDLWTESYTLTNAPGFTNAAGNDFTGETVGAAGSRIDYILVHDPPPPPPARGIHNPGGRRPRQR